MSCCKWNINRKQNLHPASSRGRSVVLMASAVTLPMATRRSLGSLPGPFPRSLIVRFTRLRSWNFIAHNSLALAPVSKRVNKMARSRSNVDRSVLVSSLVFQLRVVSQARRILPSRPGKLNDRQRRFRKLNLPKNVRLYQFFIHRPVPKGGDINMDIQNWFWW